METPPNPSSDQAIRKELLRLRSELHRLEIMRHADALKHPVSLSELKPAQVSRVSLALAMGGSVAWMLGGKVARLIKFGVRVAAIWRLVRLWKQWNLHKP